MVTVRLRPLEDGDVAAVLELAVRAWAPVFASFEEVMGPELYRRLYPDWTSQQRQAVREALQANETWVAVVDGEVAGFVNVIFDAAEAAGEIHMIAVEPPRQRLGLGGELTELAVAEMERRGLTLATVGTGGDPGHAAARGFYEKAGFSPFPQVLYSKLIGG